MKERRKNRKKKNVLLSIYLISCLFVVIFAYVHLSRIAREYNALHMELITGLYAEKINNAMDYIKNYVTEEAQLLEVLEEMEPEEVLDHLQYRLDQVAFDNQGVILRDGEILGDACTANDLRKKGLHQQALEAEDVFISDPYQASETGNIILTIFVPLKHSQKMKSLYVSVTIEDIRQLGISNLLRGKVDVYLLKADSENYITCIGTETDKTGNWNNLLLQQKYYKYNYGYSYHQWVKDMKSGKESGEFTAEVRGQDCTISYESISSMQGWYAVVCIANEDVADITLQFSEWGGIYAAILVGITIWYMMTILILENRDKKHYMGLSSTDALTGILNRAAFQRAVEEALQKKTEGILVFVDVDDFKRCNDVYGHQNGDLCLIHFANTLKKCLPGDTILGRYGGDEFVVYLKNVSVAEARRYMEHFQQEVSQLRLSSGEQVPMSASAGGALYPTQGEDYVSLCRQADIMLYDVKRSGKANFKVHGN